MPRGFSEREKTIIRAALISKGRELFTLYGLKKTSVEDLARAAGISKGAFYLFYGSKEELLLEISEQFEAGYCERVLESIAQHPGATPAEVKQVLRSMVLDWQADPLFTHLGKGDIQLLLRKLPEEKAQAVLRDDIQVAERMIAAWRQVGLSVTCGPEMLASLLRALLLINLHQEDFVAAAYPAMLDTLIDLVAGYLVASS